MGLTLDSFFFTSGDYSLHSFGAKQLRNRPVLTRFTNLVGDIIAGLDWSEIEQLKAWERCSEFILDRPAAIILDGLELLEHFCFVELISFAILFFPRVKTFLFPWIEFFKTNECCPLLFFAMSKFLPHGQKILKDEVFGSWSKFLNWILVFFCLPQRSRIINGYLSLKSIYQ